MGIEEQRGAQVPLDLPFIDSNGKPVVFGDLFDGTRPVLLTLNYSNCPMLCSLQLDGLFDGAAGRCPGRWVRISRWSRSASIRWRPRSGPN